MIPSPSDLIGPVGWTCTRSDHAEILFEHEEWPGEVRATRESEDLWRVEWIERAGEAESSRTVGYACTRDRAFDALSECMHAMNRIRDRTGVLRTMMTSTLSLYGHDVGVRGVTPEGRSTDRPFERQIATGTERTPWRGAPDRSDADLRADDAEARETERAADTDGDERRKDRQNRPVHH